MAEGKVLQEGKFFSPDEWLALRGGTYCIRKSRIISYEIVTGDTYQYVGLRCQGDVNITLLESDAAEFMALLRAETGATYPVPRNLPKAVVVTQGLECALAGVLKEMADREQVRVDGDGDHYLLYSDLVEAFNARYGKRGDELKPRTVGVICRDVFQWPVYRMDAGWAVYLDQARLAELAERFGLNALNTPLVAGERPTWRDDYKAAPKRRTNTGYETQLPNGNWISSRDYEAWWKAEQGKQG